MKYVLVLAILASLGGCIITPGYGDNRDGYHRDRGYSDNNYRGNNYDGDRGYRGYPYHDHGG